MAKPYCVCPLRIEVNSNVAFLLLMYDTEVLKPSNTGKLIADLIPDTHAFLWSRTEVNKQLIEVINHDKYQPYVVFPAEYAMESNKVYHQSLADRSDKTPLFIMLDGSWREAKKMFRKSPYLKSLPVLSVDPQVVVSSEYSSKYHIRNSAKSNQLATAEVAAHVLSIAEERENAELLDCWFDVYSYQYQKSVCQANKGDPDALQRYEELRDKYSKL